MKSNIPAEDALIIQLAVWRLQAHWSTNRWVDYDEFKQWISKTTYKDEAILSLKEVVKGFPKSLIHFYYKILVWKLSLEQYENKMKQKQLLY